MSAADEKKRLDARIRVCFEEQITHVRAGTWRDLDGANVRLLGSARELHASVCTCCTHTTTKDAS